MNIASFSFPMNCLSPSSQMPIMEKSNQKSNSTLTLTGMGWEGGIGQAAPGALSFKFLMKEYLNPL